MRTATLVIAIAVIALVALGLVIAAVADRKRGEDVASDPERVTEDPNAPHETTDDRF